MEIKLQREQPKQYWKTIREREKKMFPEFQNSEIYAPKESRYFYYAPSHHFESGLITEQDVNDLRDNPSKKLLSIGSGPAFLEKLLVKLGVKKDNITISDINPKILPRDFKSKIIDMRGEWTNLEGEQYDLIIFPESFLGVVPLEKGYNMSVEEWSQSKQDGLFHIIMQSLNHLRPDGKIRINGHELDESEIRAVMERFKMHGHKIKIKYTNNLIEIKRETPPNNVYKVQEKTH